MSDEGEFLFGYGSKKHLRVPGSAPVTTTRWGSEYPSLCGAFGYAAGSEMFGTPDRPTCKRCAKAAS